MVPNDDGETTQPKQRITTIVLAVLAIFFMFLRLAARQMKRAPLGMDDWTLIMGLVFVVALAAVNIVCIHYGLGRHMDAILPTDQPIFLKLVYAFEPIYITTVGIIKLSVLLMYHRIFPVRLIKIGGYILGGITIAWVVSVDLVAIFQCTPIARVYNPMLPGHCIDLKAALIGNGVPNFVTDICILALPARLIWRLQASTLQRISIILVFLSGSFVVFASIYRFSLIFIFNITDLSWTLADAQTWCVVETAAGIISACLPTTAPLIKSCTSTFVSTVRSSSKFNNTQSATGGNKPGRAGVAKSTNAEGVLEGTGERDYALERVGPGNLGSRSHAKGKGWTMIGADVDSD
ncbi:hypothetical protein N7474_001929 [Penicillium riverlandense]|uniref:uncharacterized protein n=1 Tax=Penicillium riverlandense TaxID=1903569 RepID=UPI002549631D|nr:uncharacterized protein N7474_001929 [Penicillium riverlandense]KAJ5833618.1 hypothetical protein N7474_001929 [Penicillium riverlandense]